MNDIHKFLAPYGIGTGASPCVVCGQYGSSPIHSMKARTGPLDLPFTEFGEVVQALASCLIDRGYTRDQVISRLRDEDNFIESEWWDARGGKIIDNFADFIDLPAYPGDEHD